jgi:hypothetical protein
MTFTRSMLEEISASLHRFGEQAHLHAGFTIPHLLLVAPDLVADAVVLPGGKPAAAGHALLRRRAAAIGAVAAAFTSEAWLGFVSVPASGFENLAPDDLPRAAHLPDRIEAIATSAVWPAGGARVHRITRIERTPAGSLLGPAEQISARDYGTNRWLESLITPRAATRP